MGRLLASFVVVLLLVCLVAPAGGNGGEVSLASSTTAQQFDHTEFRIVAFENGSARWTFRYGKSLANASEESQFREFASRFDNESLPLYTDFRTKATSLAAAGATQTGREMTAMQFQKDARLEGLNDDLGVVEMSFTWTNFSETSGETVTIGDVFEGGLYLSDGQRLVVAATDPLSFQQAEPTPDDLGGSTLAAADSVTWRGERRFTDNHPLVVLVPKATTTAAPTTVGTTAGEGGTNDSASGGSDGSTDGNDSGDGTSTVTTADDPDDVLSTVPWLAITAFAAMLVIGAVVLLQRAGIAFDGAGEGGDVVDGGGPGGPGAPPPIAGEPAVPDEEMVTDEERVIGLLRDNGGRMRQVNIVEETGWSKSKVSMLLSEMEEEEQVTKLRVGRENIVSLPGHEPGASGSALE